MNSIWLWITIGIIMIGSCLFTISLMMASKDGDERAREAFNDKFVHGNKKRRDL